MNIQKTNFTNVNFNATVRTANVLEITTHKIFEPEGFEGYKKTVRVLYGNMPKYLGQKGYEYYANIVRSKIFEKYPDIAKATQEALQNISKHHLSKPQEIQIVIAPIINRLGEEIDIVL